MGERKSFVDRPDIRPAAARADDGERPPRFAPEKEKAGIVLARIHTLFRIGIDVVKKPVAVMDIIDHSVDGLHGPLARHVVVIR